MPKEKSIMSPTGKMTCRTQIQCPGNLIRFKSIKTIQQKEEHGESEAHNDDVETHRYPGDLNTESHTRREIRYFCDLAKLAAINESFS